MIELNFTWVHPTIKEEIIEHFKDAYVEHFWNCIEYSQSNGSLLYSCKNSYIKIMSGCLMFAEKGSNSYRHCGMIEQENKKFLLLTKIFDEKENIEMIDSNTEDINKSGFLNLEEGVSIYKNPEDKVASELKKSYQNISRMKIYTFIIPIKRTIKVMFINITQFMHKPKKQMKEYVILKIHII